MRSSNSIKTKVAEFSEIPKDVLMGVTVINITGDTEINIENHKGIIEYTDTLIRIRTKSGGIVITGHKLFVSSYANDEMIVKGNIDSVELKNQEVFKCSK